MLTAISLSQLDPGLAQSLAFRAWVVSLVLLFFKMFVNSGVQAIVRLRTGTFTRPDDARVFGRGAEAAAREHPIVERANGCWRNDLENIPAYLLISLAFVLAGGAGRQAVVYFGLYTLIRCVHTLVYLLGLQPHRFLVFTAGNIVLFALVANLLLVVFA